MRIHIVEEGPSWYPSLGDCPCGHGRILMVTMDGSIQHFACGRKSEDDAFCGQRFIQRSTGEQGQWLCCREGETELYDFGRMVEEKGARYFESHLTEA